MSAEEIEFNDDTVDALHDTVRDFLRDEDSRLQSLLGRGASLAGFAGLIVALSGLVAREILATDSSASQRATAGGLLIGALAFLIATIVVLILGILWPRPYVTIDMEEIERYPYPEFITQRKAMVQGSTMRGLIAALASERQRNAQKVFWLKWAYALLIAGLLLVSAAVATLVSEAL